MTINDTVIEGGGVIRCCLATVALEYEGKEVKLGDTSVCPHCKTKFVLVAPEQADTTCFRDLTKPIWKPERQLKEHNDGAKTSRTNDY